MWNTFCAVFGSVKKMLLVLSLFIVFFVLFRTVSFYQPLYDAFLLPNMTLGLKIATWYEYVWVGFWFESGLNKLLQIGLFVLSAFNAILFWVYAKRQHALVRKKTFWASLSGLVLGVFGVGCVSCGVFVLSPLLVFLGLGAYVSFFQTQAVLFSLLGICLLLISVFILLHRLSKSLVCKL